MKHSSVLCFIQVLFYLNNTNAQVAIPTVDSTTLYSYKWELFNIPHYNLYKEDSRLPNLLLYPGANASFTGEAGCNDVEGHLIVDVKNKIRFTDIVEDVYECDHDLDQKFIKMLRRVDHYKIKNNQLILYNKFNFVLSKFYGDITELSFNKIIALQGVWSQDLLKNESGWVNLKLVDSLPTITFNATDLSTIHGYTGCNSIISNITISNNQIHFSDIKVEGQNDCSNETEKFYLINLSSAAFFSVSDELLYLWTGQSLTMSFRRVNNIKVLDGPVAKYLQKKMKIMSKLEYDL